MALNIETEKRKDRTMKNADIKTAYDRTQKDISGLLGFFEVELDKERTEVSGYDLAEIRRARTLLLNALSAMSGACIGDITIALDEMNL